MCGDSGPNLAGLELNSELRLSNHFDPKAKKTISADNFSFSPAKPSPVLPCLSIPSVKGRLADKLTPVLNSAWNCGSYLRSHQVGVALSEPNVPTDHSLSPLWVSDSCLRTPTHRRELDGAWKWVTTESGKPSLNYCFCCSTEGKWFLFI